MIHPRQLHSLGKHYHEEALQVARVRRLEHEAKAHRRPRSEKQVRWLGSWPLLSGSPDAPVGQT